MWNENDDIIKLIDIKEAKGEKYPLRCPICNTNNIHIYYHRFEKDVFGAGWVWCSNCKSYAHVRYKIPKGWKNLSDINEERLNNNPEYLEGIKKEIDILVNSQAV